MNPELINYIRSARASGMADAQIADVLLKAGWREPDIRDAFGSAASQMPVSTIASQAAIPKRSPLLLISLVVGAILVAGGGAFAYYYAVQNRQQAQAPAIVTPQNTIAEQQATTTAPLDTVNSVATKLSTVPEGAKVISPVVLSPDARHVMYAIEQGDKQHVVVDDTVGPAFDKILWDGYYFITFSWRPDSYDFGYIALNGSEQNAEIFAVTKDRRFGPYKTVLGPVFSPNNKDLFLWVSDREKNESSLHVVTPEGTTEYKGFPQGEGFPLSISSTGSFAFPVCDLAEGVPSGQSCSVIFNGKKLPGTFDYVSSIGYGAKHDGLLMYVGMRDEKEYLYIDESTEPTITAARITIYDEATADELQKDHGELFYAEDIESPAVSVKTGYGYGDIRNIAKGDLSSLDVTAYVRPLDVKITGSSGEDRFIMVNGKQALGPYQDTAAAIDSFGVEASFNSTQTAAVLGALRKDNTFVVILIDASGAREIPFPNQEIFKPTGTEALSAGPGADQLNIFGATTKFNEADEIVVTSGAYRAGYYYINGSFVDGKSYAGRPAILDKPADASYDYQNNFETSYRLKDSSGYLYFVKDNGVQKVYKGSTLIVPSYVQDTSLFSVRYHVFDAAKKLGLLTKDGSDYWWRVYDIP